MRTLWDVKKEDFPSQANLADKIKFILGYAILAPSTHNSQPWLFKIENSSCKIYYDSNLRLPEADPLGRDLYISMGCLIDNLLIAANYFGIFKNININLKDNFVAEVFFQDIGSTNHDLEYLVDTIPKRVNSRGFFESKLLPDSIQAEILAMNKNDHIRLSFVTDKEKINALASLTAEGLKIAHGKPSFRKEMSGWMHSSISSKKDGLPGYSLKMPFVLSFIIPALVRFFNLSPLFAKLNYKSMGSAPFICIISASESNNLIWLEVGQLAERLMLHLSSKGIKTSIFVASIEAGDLYKKVQDVLDTNYLPQFIFCAGYMSDSQKHSPRHPLNDKIIL